MMSWTEHAIWWHVYPLGFVGAPIRGHAEAGVEHRLAQLQEWLDYAVELGVSGLALGPVFASHSHGYDTVDHLRIDPRLGDDSDFDRLVAACRARGLRVLLDGVFNHVGSAHPLFRRALAEGPGGAASGLFRIDWAAGEPRHADFEGHSDLVALNHDSPQVAALVTDVMAHWLRRGADGWRLDAAYAVPAQFWRRVLPAVRAEFPGAFVVGEVIRGDYGAIVSASGMDSVTQYELWKAIWSSLAQRNLFELAWALDRHNTFLDSFVPLTFVGNHDVTRVASLVGDRSAVLALVVLCTVGGMPSIYYGDEQGFRGVKEERVGGDDAVRPAFPATPDALPASGWPMYRVHQELIGLRRRHPWLVSARTTMVSLTNERLVYAVAPQAGGPGLSVELDLTGRPRARVTKAGTVEFAFG